MIFQFVDTCAPSLQSQSQFYSKPFKKPYPLNRAAHSSVPYLEMGLKPNMVTLLTPQLLTP